MAPTQGNRLIAIQTPLGQDALLLAKFSGRELISGLFHFTAEMLSLNHSLDLGDVIGKKVTISINLPDQSKRYWNGHVSRFGYAGRDDQFTHYQAEIVPWFWLLTRTADCQIFQQKTVTDIIKKVFQDHGFQDFEDRTQATYPQREYVVQYRETAFNFVSRLMEDAGIFYFFEHDQSTHKLVLADSPQVHKNCLGQYKVRFNYSGGALVKDEDLIINWDAERELRPGKYALTDYNFQTPKTSLLSNVQTVDQVGDNTKYEIFDYPGTHTKKSEGDALTKVRMEEEEAVHSIVSGSSNCRSFAAGFKFNLDEHARKDQNGDFLLTEVSHAASVAESYATSDKQSQETYSNHFTCIPFAVPFRPQRHTPKPIVQGPQTAVVVGPSGEEIYPDKYGRVRVQFFWDRQGKKDENSSCWVRVSQPWAGKNWGAINIPRIGQEVIVDFLEGDPDRPIITGRVYNDEQMPPYTLPDNMTRTTFMTRSSKGGGSSNYNELRFEDKKGDEQIFMNAEKDMDWRVENDSREFVGKDRSLIVKGDQKEKVSGEQHIQIVNDQNESVGGDSSLNVTGNQNVKVGQTMSLQVGQNLQEKSGQNYAHEAGMEIHLKAGMNVVIEAGLELTIQASGNFINIGPAGVAISGTLVLINSGGAAGSGSPSNPTDPKSPKDPDTADDGSKGGKM
ncbi:MAG TPA: type VI secretion system tip protein TssI/VgrG [Candidatus Methylomirabilis sp.]|nr:type VI secretion system tip protein TssI/VgrG [Candidatus Methylomirabilis sp.]